MGGHNLCILWCRNNQNEEKLLISEVLDTQWRGVSLQGKVLEGTN